MRVKVHMHKTYSEILVILQKLTNKYGSFFNLPYTMVVRVISFQKTWTTLFFELHPNYHSHAIHVSIDLWLFDDLDGAPTHQNISLPISLPTFRMCKKRFWVDSRKKIKLIDVTLHVNEKYIFYFFIKWIDIKWKTLFVENIHSFISLRIRTENPFHENSSSTSLCWDRHACL